MFLALWLIQCVLVWTGSLIFWIKIAKEDLKFKHILVGFFIGGIPLIGLLTFGLIFVAVFCVLWEDKNSIFHKTIIKAKK